MVQVTFIEQNGNRRVVEIGDGQSVMSGAVNNLLRGISADCGGACACATCHVYVEEGWNERLPPMDETENELLEGVASDREVNSRLSCQIIVDGSCEGLVIRIPDRQ
jgi:2Fe-2S ferredoxin